MNIGGPHPRHFKPVSFDFSLHRTNWCYNARGQTKGYKCTNGLWHLNHRTGFAQSC